MESASRRRTGRTIVIVLIVLAALGGMALLITGAALGELAGGQTNGVFAEIRIRPPQQLLLDAEIEHQGRFEVYRQTQARLIKSVFVLQRAIRSPEIAQLELIRRQSRPVDWLDENLTVSFPGTEFMRVSLPGHQSAEAAAIINAVVDAYMREAVDKDDEGRRRRLTKIEKISAGLSREIERLEADRRRQRELMTAPPQPGVALLELEMMRQEYTRLRLRRIQLEAALAVERADDAEPNKVADGPDPQRRELDAVKHQIEAFESEYQAVLDQKIESRSAEIVLSNIDRKIARKESVLRQVQEQVEKLTIELNAPIGVEKFREATPVE